VNERSGLIRIPPPFQLDAATDFRKDYDARPDFLNRSPSDPSGNVRVGSLALADF
jgi:hypothetical protein